jgi:hypothetical protein
VKTDDSPGKRFLLGFHYGYLGYPKEAVRELDKAVELNPKDKLAAELRNVMAAKLGPAEALPMTAPGEAATTQ